MKHDPLDDDYDIMSEGKWARQAARQLRARALRHPDPRDPDALDEDEYERLEALEHWEP